MATTQSEGRAGTIRGVSARRAGVDETKAAFKTTELMSFVVVALLVLIASKMDDSLDGRGAWTLVSALTIGYMISRGLAKSGSRHHEDRDTI